MLQNSAVERTRADHRGKTIICALCLQSWVCCVHLFTLMLAACDGPPQKLAAPECDQPCLNGGFCSAPNTCDCSDTDLSGRQCADLIGFVRVTAGSFTMGSPDWEANYSGEVQHQVTLTRGFWMKRTEVTQAEWRAVMKTDPSHFSACGDQCPVEQVNWFMAVAYTNALSRDAGLGECYQLSDCFGNPGVGNYTCAAVSFVGVHCQGYRLPTEAEWEYAARAGTQTALYNGDLTIVGSRNGPELDPIAWYGGNSGVSYAGGVVCSDFEEAQFPSAYCGTHPVGLKQENPWGLEDMLGNVEEWITDWSGDYGEDAIDPVGPASGEQRVIRGASWFSVVRRTRTANRGQWWPDSHLVGSIGLRPVRTMPNPD